MIEDRETWFVWLEQLTVWWFNCPTQIESLGNSKSADFQIVILLIVLFMLIFSVNLCNHNMEVLSITRILWNPLSLNFKDNIDPVLFLLYYPKKLRIVGLSINLSHWSKFFLAASWPLRAFDSIIHYDLQRRNNCRPYSETLYLVSFWFDKLYLPSRSDSNIF